MHDQWMGACCDALYSVMVSTAGDYVRNNGKGVCRRSGEARGLEMSQGAKVDIDKKVWIKVEERIGSGSGVGLGGDDTWDLVKGT